jgi:ribosomal protein L37AE/L43A
MQNGMLFKRPLSTSLLSNQIKYGERQRQAKYSSHCGFCKVCGDRANIINYGALSCQSCKTFFRRNGYRPKVCSLLKLDFYNRFSSCRMFDRAFSIECVK